MKFLCDVHISFSVVKWLIAKNHTAEHVNNILRGCFTPDHDICKYADENNFIIITKDYDFKNSFFVLKTPAKLIKINLGNVSNEALIKLIEDNLDVISFLNKKQKFILELGEGFPFYYSE